MFLVALHQWLEPALDHGGDQLGLTLEVILEGSHGESRGRLNHCAYTAARKELLGAIQQTFTLRRAGHGVSAHGHRSGGSWSRR
jgi:hypothetical protein